MEANELRIGNIVKYYKDEEYVVKCGVDIDLSDMYEPIPLTEEWLVKLGFYKEQRQNKGFITYTRDMYKHIKIPMHSVYYFNVYGEHNYFYDGHSYPQYVHKLQNSFFVIHGTELTIEKIKWSDSVGRVETTKEILYGYSEVVDKKRPSKGTGKVRELKNNDKTWGCGGDKV